MTPALPSVLKNAKISAARFLPKPGAAAISCSLAARSFWMFPKCDSKAARRLGPRAGQASSTLSFIFLERSWALKELAKRCASSRRRCSSRSARSSRGRVSGFFSGSAKMICSSFYARPIRGGGFKPCASKALRAALTWPSPPSITTRSGKRFFSACKRV